MGRELSLKADTDMSAQDRARRAATLFVVQCRRADKTLAAIKVRNLSATGLKGECPDVADFAVGEEVRITFKNLTPVNASVVWFEGSTVAFQFRNPVDLDRITRARSLNQLPDESPRSEAVANWIDRNTKREIWEKQAKGIKGPRSL